MNEKSWASTYLDYKGFKVTATEMGDTAEQALTKLMDMLDAVDAKPWADRNNIYVKPDLIEQADEIPFGEPVQSLATEPDDIFADPPQVPPAPTTTLEDGTQYLGIKTQKPKVADCLVGQSYEILVDSYSTDDREIRFYNEHSQYPACTHNLSSEKGREIFTEIFSDWIPKAGSKVKLTNPVLLYIVGGGQTSEGNAYQNLKSAKKP